jgi:hydrogenase assembly chaperone HypC/HupF
MCVTAPARVLSVDEGGATVLLGGRPRRASTLVVPEVVAGDWVIVGAGTILERLSDDEATAVSAAVEAATREEG